MKLTTYTFEAPAHWASALINGDTTGLSDEEDAEFNAWCQANPECHREVVSCEDDSWFGRFNGLRCDMLTYQALKRES